MVVDGWMDWKTTDVVVGCPEDDPMLAKLITPATCKARMTVQKKRRGIMMENSEDVVSCDQVW